MRTVLQLLAVAAVASSGVHAEPAKHAGPVTDILVLGKQVYSCSQAGVFLSPLTDPERPIAVTPFTTIALAGSDFDREKILFLAGGEAGVSGNVAVFDTIGGALSFEERLADDLVYSIALGPAIFLALADGRVLEFDPGGADAVPRHRHTAAARSVRVSSDGKFLASAGMDRLVIVSNLNRDSDPIAIQDHTAPVECLAFSPDASLIASGARDGKVRIHTPADGKLIRSYHNLDGEVSAIAWGGKTERLLAGTTKGLIYQLDLSNDTAAVTADWGTESPITALAISPKGHAYAGTLNRIDRAGDTSEARTDNPKQTR